MITVYTDGSCDPNPGPGGWAAVIQFGDGEKVLSGSNPQTTNNRMELKAALEALLAIEPTEKIALYTDSEYL